jgi:hypothetical protein
MRLSPLRRGLLYGAIAGLGIAAVPGVAAVVISISEGALAWEIALVALSYGLVLGTAGFVIGCCQPAPRRGAPGVQQSGEGFWRRLGRWLYLLVVGVLIGWIFAMIACLPHAALLLATDGSRQPHERRTALQDLVFTTAFTAMAGSEVGGLLGSVLGAFLGATVRTDRPQPPIMRAAAFAGGFGVVLGSVLGIGPGVILSLDADYARRHRVFDSFGLALTAALVFALLLGVLAAIVAGWLARRLVQIRAGANND